MSGITPESKPEPKSEWLNPIRKILMNNLSPFDTFVANLGTKDFNATAKWEQLNNTTIETLFFKFMELYEQTPNPSLKQIISALKDIPRNDIIKTIQENEKLKEQLEKEGIRNEDHPQLTSEDGNCNMTTNTNIHKEPIRTDCPCEGGKSSKTTWLNIIRKILIDNLGQLDLFVAHLGTSEFNATAKWEQLNQNKNQTQFYKFMDVWYGQPDPSLKQIISALKDIPRNDIIKTIQDDGQLRQQLIKEGIIDESYGVRKLPTQVMSEDGNCQMKTKNRK